MSHCAARWGEASRGVTRAEFLRNGEWACPRQNGSDAITRCRESTSASGLVDLRAITIRSNVTARSRIIPPAEENSPGRAVAPSSSITP